MNTKHDSYSVNKIQIRDTGSSLTIGEDNDSVGWRNLPEILESSGKGYTNKFNDAE